MVGFGSRLLEKLGISNQRVQDLDGLHKSDQKFSLRRLCRDHPRLAKAFIACCILFALTMVVIIIVMIVLLTKPPSSTTPMPTTTIPTTTTTTTSTITQVLLPEPPSPIHYRVSCRVFDASDPGCGSFGECYYVKTDEEYTRQCKCHDGYIVLEDSTFCQPYLDILDYEPEVPYTERELRAFEKILHYLKYNNRKIRVKK